MQADLDTLDQDLRDGGSLVVSLRAVAPEPFSLDSNFASLAARAAVIAKRSTLYEDIHFWSTYAIGMALLASAEQEAIEGQTFRERKLAEVGA